jgi:phosphoribosylanthranilate isomerase
MRRLFRTKVCGVKTSVDLRNAAKAGVGAIGLNFVPESPRFITPTEAANLISTVNPQCALVGVFVNPTPSYVQQVLRLIPLQYVQLHGEEQADLWRDFAAAPIIKAVRWSGDRDQIRDLTSWHQLLGGRLAAFLIDAPSSQLRGGSGLKADWSTLVPRPAVLAGKPLILAGGLTPENVAKAIGQVEPAAVDTASGVEVSPGVKDAEKMQLFVGRAMAAWGKSG